MASEQDLTLGEYIIKMRQRLRMSAKQLAREAEVAHSSISRIESGEVAAPNLELLKRIADVLDIDIAELLKRCGVSVETSDLQTYLRRNYDLPQEGVAEAEEAIARIAKKYRSQDS